MTKRKPKTATDFAQIWSKVNSPAAQPAAAKAKAKPKPKRPTTTSQRQKKARQVVATKKAAAVFRPRQAPAPSRPQPKPPAKKRACIFLDEVVVQLRKPQRDNWFEPVLLVRRGQTVVVAEEISLPMPPSVPSVYNRTELAREAIGEFFATRSRAAKPPFAAPPRPTMPHHQPEPDELPQPRADFLQYLQAKPTAALPQPKLKSLGQTLRWHLARLLLRDMV